MRVVLGSAPDSWGVWFPDDPHQTPWRRFLDEVAAAGYRWIELGPYGYLPTDPEELGAELARRELQVTGTFAMFPLEDRDRWAAARDHVEATCELIRGVNGRYLILIDDFYTNVFTGEWLAPSELGDAEWAQLVQTTNELAEVAGRYGLTAVFHPHSETHVEYEPQIERLLADTDDRVGLCLDVGHHAYRGGDPVEFMRRNHERIPYLHLKSVDRNVQRRVETEAIPFGDAVKIDMFVEPSRGAVDFPAFKDVLEEVGYDGFGIVEQDMYPAPFEKPLPIARRTREYLIEIGVG
jgi:inosose dehydratase